MSNIVWHHGNISRQDRRDTYGHAGATLWLTGLSGSGKSTIAVALEEELIKRRAVTYRLDGDNVRHGLNADLGFSPEDRTENIRRISEVSRLFADAGCLTLVSFISPYRSDRARARELHVEAELPFLEVFIDTPIEVCEQRDPKGLYKKARAGEIKGFTGIDDPYESPESPEIHLKTDEMSISEAVRVCIDTLASNSILD